MAISIVSMINTLDSAKERKARLLCPSLIANAFPHLHSYQSFYPTGSVAAFKNAQLTFGYMVHPSSPTPRKRTSSNSIIPCTSMMSTTVDPLRLAARSIVSEVKTYDMLQSHQGICIPRCFGLYPTGFPEQDMCPATGARCWDRFAVPPRMETGRKLSPIISRGTVRGYIRHALPVDDGFYGSRCPSGRFGPNERYF